MRTGTNKHIITGLILVFFIWPHVHQDIHRVLHRSCHHADEACSTDQECDTPCTICEYSLYLGTFHSNTVLLNVFRTAKAQLTFFLQNTPQAQKLRLQFPRAPPQ